MEQIQVQRVQKEDLPEVARIRIEGWKTAYRGIIDDYFLDNLSIEKDQQKREKDYQLNGFLVAKIGEKVVGFCRYVGDNQFSPDRTDIDCEITALYVAPEKPYVFCDFLVFTQTNLIISPTRPKRIS